MSRRSATPIQSRRAKPAPRRKIERPPDPPHGRAVSNGSAVSAVSEVDLILARFRLRARLRAAWLQHLWSTRGAGANGSVAPADAAFLLSDLDEPAAEIVWQKEDVACRAWLAEVRRIEQELSALTPDQSRRTRLGNIFGFEAADGDLLEACAALAFDPSLGRVCAFLHDQSGHPFVTDELVARLYGHGRYGVWGPESPVFRWQMVEASTAVPGEPRVLSCDPQIRDWLAGRPRLDPFLVDAAWLQAAPEPLAQWPVEDVAGWFQQAMQREGTRRLRVVVTGAQGSGRKSFAAAVARHAGLPLLVIDADQIDDVDWRTTFVRAQRQAFLDSCALAWIGESLAQRLWPQNVATFPVQFCLGRPGHEPAPVSGMVERRMLLPSATCDDRVRLWQEQIPAARRWPARELQKLAAEHPVHPGDIAHAAEAGVTDAASAGRRAREAARARFNGLAQHMECPFGWDDLVLPRPVLDTLRTIAFEARQRHRFWENPEARRLFPQGRGLAALFTGAPGTGKTMAAQVIAAELGQDLFRVNLAHLVSKWVGETAKNIDWLLKEAAALDAIVFFDEADAAFAKRSSEVRDAQDRFANTDAAHLLQAIESYPGVAFLATNLKGNIDQAFFRRLRYVVEFPKPDPALQRELWRRLVTALAGAEVCKKLSPVLERLSATVETTGAQIKFAVLTATFAAQRDKSELGAAHLLDGLQAELSKEGRGVGVKERERILNVA